MTSIRAIEMAQEFPHVEVKGLDLAPPHNLSEPDKIPANCSFDVADANTEMKRYAEAFSLVHIRAAHVGIADFHGFLYDVARSLRPKGVLLVGFVNPVSRGSRLWSA